MPTQKNPQNRVEAAQPAEHSATEHSATEHSAIDSVHRVVNVCAVAIRDERGYVLTVRKKSSDGFMMPGGKPEPGESPVQTACREVSEEIGLTPDSARMHYRNLRVRPHRRAVRAAGYAGAAGRNCRAALGRSRHGPPFRYRRAGTAEYRADFPAAGGHSGSAGLAYRRTRRPRAPVLSTGLPCTHEVHRYVRYPQQQTTHRRRGATQRTRCTTQGEP